MISAIYVNDQNVKAVLVFSLPAAIYQVIIDVISSNQRKLGYFSNTRALPLLKKLVVAVYHATDYHSLVKT